MSTRQSNEIAAISPGAHAPLSKYERLINAGEAGRAPCHDGRRPSLR